MSAWRIWAAGPRLSWRRGPAKPGSSTTRLSGAAPRPAPAARSKIAVRPIMSTDPRPILPRDFARMKDARDRIVMVTAYDAPSARLADEAGVDAVLVGDSAAMTMLGYDSTVRVTVDEMLMLTRAVTRTVR